MICGVCGGRHPWWAVCESHIARMRREERVRRVQELRRSSAAEPVPSGRAYRRRPKHRDTPED